MIVRFGTRPLQRVSNDGVAARKALGERCAGLLRRRLDDLSAAANLEQVRHLPGRCHELKGNRTGEFAVDLEHPRRLIFEPLDGDRRDDGGFDWSSITAIEIVEIVDYH